ncbi:unnamed protein product [Closterium sp. NIES-65]|nr:unnamed protein product [Closterium sp. NIES-65]
MYALFTNAEGVCHLCVPPDPGIQSAALGAGEAAALGASAFIAQGAGESTLSGTTLAQAFHTFTLDSGASRSFFRDRTTLTPLSRPVAVSLADPSGGPVLASFSTNLPCPAAPSGTLLPFGTTALVTPPCLVSEAWPPMSLSLVFPGLSLPYLRGLPLPASPASRGDSAPPLTPPSFLRQRLRCKLFTWTCGAPPTQGHERYFLLVVDDYSRYTTVFPLRSKGDVTEVLIDWIRAARLQLRESFSSEFPVLRLHSDRGGEFSSARLGAFCHAQGIRQTFTLPASPQQNGIAERGIGMVMDVARTSMIHAAAPHFLWPYAVRYPAHQLNLQPRVSLPKTSPTLRWTWKVGDASAFRVWGSRAFVRDLYADKLSPRAVPYVDALKPLEVAVNSGAARGAEPVCAGSGGAESGGVETGGAEPGGAGSGGAEPGGAETRGAEHGGVEPRGAGAARVAGGGASSRREPLSPWELREWFARRWRRAAGAGGTTVAAGPGGARTGGPRAAGTRGAAGATGVGPLEAAGGVSAAGARATGGVGAGLSTGAGASGGAAETAGADGPTGLVLLELELLGVLALAVLLALVLLRVLELALLELEVVLARVLPLGIQSQSQLQPASPLPAPSPYTGPTGGLAERLEPASRPASPVRAAHISGRTARLRPPAVPDTHEMALRPSTTPLRVPLLSPPESPLPTLADSESDSLHATSPTLTRLLATVVTDPTFESVAASALVAELVDFATRCRLDYVASLWQPAMDAEMASWKSTGTYVDEVPLPGANIVNGMWIFRVKRPPGSPPVFKARYVARGFTAQRDYELHSLDFRTAFLQGSLHEEIWLRCPPGFTGSFHPGTQWSLRRPVYGLRQAPREWHDTPSTTLAALGFAPSTTDPSVFLRTDTSLPPFYILVYVDDLVFATADTA